MSTPSSARRPNYSRLRGVFANRDDLGRLENGGQVSEHKADWEFMVDGVLVKMILIGLSYSCRRVTCDIASAKLQGKPQPKLAAVKEEREMAMHRP